MLATIQRSFTADILCAAAGVCWLMASGRRQMASAEGRWLYKSSAHLRCLSDDLFCDVHHVVVVSIRLIQLYGCELGVVP